MDTKPVTTPQHFLDAAAAIAADVGPTTDVTINNGGRYIRYQLRAPNGAHYRDGTGQVRKIDGQRDGKFYSHTLTEPIQVAAGAGISAEAPDFRLFVLALRQHGIVTNDGDGPGEAPILDGRLTEGTPDHG